MRKEVAEEIRTIFNAPDQATAEAYLARIEKNLQGLTGAILFTALFIGGMQLALAGNTLPGFILLGSALIPLLVILFK
jgi:hypothetical protein